MDRPDLVAAPVTTGMEVYYDRRAREYDDFYLGRGLYDKSRPAWREDLAALTAVVAGLPPAKVLDVACGTGFLTRHLRGSVTALDQSSRMLEVARTRLPDARLVRGSAFALPFEDNSFDRIFTGHFYGHLRPHQREIFLAEVARVAAELVVVDAARRAGGRAEAVQCRPLLVDGSTHDVYKRWFTEDELAREVGGGMVLHAGPWFVVVSARLA